MSIMIEEASAKIRDDGPLDLAADYDAACWAGVIPIAPRLGIAVPDQRVPPHDAPGAEIGHFGEGGNLSAILLSLARHGAE